MSSQRIELAIIQYPGREDKFLEPPTTSFATLVEAISDQIMQIGAHCRYSFYGHSMGAALAFEICVRLGRKTSGSLPEHIFLAACNPPHRRNASTDKQIHLLTDSDFLKAITARYGALPTAIIENKEMLTIYLGILRSDLAAMASATWSDLSQLAVPLSAFGGSHDICTTPEALAEWARYTTVGCDVMMFEGGHFFHQTCTAAVVTRVANRLTAIDSWRR